MGGANVDDNRTTAAASVNVVTHEMSFAKDVSSRVLFMNEGEIWEQGTPEQIFEHPERRETYGFIFSVRSWVWDLTHPDNDHPGMLWSLSDFCTRQMAGRRLANACQHVVEELSSGRLAPLADAVGAQGAIATFKLRLPEEGEEAVLEVDCHGLVDSGVEADQLGCGDDWASEAMVAGYDMRAESDDPAVLVYDIGEGNPRRGDG